MTQNGRNGKAMTDHSNVGLNLCKFFLVTFNLNGRNGFLGNYEYLTILVISHPNSYKLPHVLPRLRENKQNLARTRLVRVFITKCGTDLPQVDCEIAKANDPHDNETEGRTPFRHTTNLIDEYGLNFVLQCQYTGTMTAKWRLGTRKHEVVFSL